jgi:uncharacterized protein (DUF488 family)
VESPCAILTIGHSTHDGERFVGLLRAHRVEVVCDVRRFPGSRRHPQFNAAPLGAILADAGISYEGFEAELGGRRRPRPDSPNLGWRVSAFRAYADHMATEEFASGLERLERIGRERRAVIMCAEGDWRRCHRRLIADALLARNWRVLHIGPDGGLAAHELPAFAVVSGEEVAYPAPRRLL